MPPAQSEGALAARRVSDSGSQLQPELHRATFHRPYACGSSASTFDSPDRSLHGSYPAARFGGIHSKSPACDPKSSRSNPWLQTPTPAILKEHDSMDDHPSRQNRWASERFRSEEHTSE